MRIHVVGLNHESAPVEVREALAFPARRLPEALSALCARDEVEEGVILSTCNRVELYAVSEDALEPDALPRFLAEFHGVWPERFQEHLYSRAGEEGVKHLFRVASGLDSMVVGEAQIAGQVREAYEIATEHGGAGRVLHHLFQQALAVAKRVRTATEIGAGRASVGSVAVELAEHIFETLGGRTVLVIGAGEMGQTVVQSLRAAGAQTTLVANRTYARAQELAEAWGGSAVQFHSVDERLRDADIVISSTDAPHYVLNRDRMRDAVASRYGRPLFLIDIAVPRDIEPAVGKLDGCYLYNIDDLEAVVQETLASREQEVSRCQAIVDEECREFFAWLARLQVVPTIKELSARLHALKEAELKALCNKLGDLPDGAEAEIERMADRLVNKILHQPIQSLRETAARGHSDGLLTAALRLFGLRRDGAPPPPRDRPKPES
jgi:glutamyl-tRNA reductase